MGGMYVVLPVRRGGGGFEYVPWLDDVGHAGEGIALLPEVGGQALWHQSVTVSGHCHVRLTSLTISRPRRGDPVRVHDGRHCPIRRFSGSRQSKQPIALFRKLFIQRQANMRTKEITPAMLRQAGE